MKPHSIGRALGIGLRIAGRIDIYTNDNVEVLSL